MAERLITHSSQWQSNQKMRIRLYTSVPCSIPCCYLLDAAVSFPPLRNRHAHPTGLRAGTGFLHRYSTCSKIISLAGKVVWTPCKKLPDAAFPRNTDTVLLLHVIPPEEALPGKALRTISLLHGGARNARINPS
jgi:hypothetical protein